VNRLVEWMAIYPLPLQKWHEAGGDLLLFCYFVALGAFVAVSSRTIAMIPGMQKLKSAPARVNPKCSTPSSISSAHSTILKD